MDWLTGVKEFFTWASGTSVGASLVRIAFGVALAKYLMRKAEKDNQEPTQSTPRGVRLQVGPATDNKITVSYGDSYSAGTVVDARLVNDNKEMYVALALTEVTGDIFSSDPNNPANRTPSKITIDELYLNNQKIKFKADGTTIDYTVDDTGVIDTNARDLVGIYLYQGNSNSPMLPTQENSVLPIPATTYTKNVVVNANVTTTTEVTTEYVSSFVGPNVVCTITTTTKVTTFTDNEDPTPDTTDVVTNVVVTTGTHWTPPAAYSIMPGWTASHTMQNTIFAIVKMNYHPQKGVHSIPNLKFRIRNTLNKPGDVLHDYMTNELYGADIPEASLNNASFTLLNSYSDDSVTLGTYPAQPRYRINGIVRTTQPVMSNIEQLAASGGSIMSYDVSTGKWSILINKLKETSSGFSDSNIIGQVNISTSNLDAFYNGIEVQFPNKLLKDQYNFVKFELPAELLTQNEASNTLQTTYEFVNNPVQATILANLELRQLREDLAITFKTDYSKYNVEIGDVFTLTNDVYGWVSKQFRVIRIQRNESEVGELTLEITAQSYNEDVYTVEDITDYVPLIGPGASFPSLAPIAKPGTPTVISATLSSQPSVTITGVVPTGVVTEMEFWYTAESTLPDANRAYTLLGTMRAENSGPFTTGDNVVFKTVLLLTGNYHFKVRATNAQGSSLFSDPSAVLNYVYKQAPDVLPYSAPVVDDNGISLAQGGAALSVGMIAAYAATKLNWGGIGEMLPSEIQDLFGITPEQVSTVNTGAATAQLEIQSEGETILSEFSSMDFVGDLVSVSGAGNSAVITVTNPTLDQLSDVAIVTPAANHVLQYNGTSWINGPAPGGTLDGLTDVSTTGAANGDFLKYNGSTWVVGGVAGTNGGTVTSISAGNGLTGGTITTTGTIALSDSVLQALQDATPTFNAPTLPKPTISLKRPNFYTGTNLSETAVSEQTLQKKVYTNSRIMLSTAPYDFHVPTATGNSPKVVAPGNYTLRIYAKGTAYRSSLSSTQDTVRVLTSKATNILSNDYLENLSWSNWTEVGSNDGTTPSANGPYYGFSPTPPPAELPTETDADGTVQLFVDCTYTKYNAPTPGTPPTIDYNGQSINPYVGPVTGNVDCRADITINVTLGANEVFAVGITNHDGMNSVTFSGNTLLEYVIGTNVPTDMQVMDVGVTPGKISYTSTDGTDTYKLEYETTLSDTSRDFTKNYMDSLTQIKNIKIKKATPVYGAAGIDAMSWTELYSNAGPFAIPSTMVHSAPSYQGVAAAGSTIVFINQKLVLSGGVLSSFTHSATSLGVVITRNFDSGFDFLAGGHDVLGGVVYRSIDGKTWFRNSSGINNMVIKSLVWIPRGKFGLSTDLLLAMEPNTGMGDAATIYGSTTGAWEVYSWPGTIVPGFGQKIKSFTYNRFALVAADEQRYYPVTAINTTAKTITASGSQHSTTDKNEVTVFGLATSSYLIHYGTGSLAVPSSGSTVGVVGARGIAIYDTTRPAGTLLINHTSIGHSIEAKTFSNLTTAQGRSHASVSALNTDVSNYALVELSAGIVKTEQAIIKGIPSDQDIEGTPCPFVYLYVS